jgi:hypothetical protein
MTYSLMTLLTQPLNPKSLAILNRVVKEGLKHCGLNVLVLGTTFLGGDLASPSQPPPALNTSDTYACIAGTNIQMLKPAGFIPSKTFPGFVQPESGAFIEVTQIPKPYASVAITMNRVSLSKRGVKLLSLDHLFVDHYSGILVRVNPLRQNQAEGQWIYLFGDDHKSTQVMASFPANREAEYSSALKAALLSVRLHNPESHFHQMHPVNGLSFGVTPVPPLLLASRVQKNILYTYNGQFPLKSQEMGVFSIGPSHTSFQIDDKKDYSMRRLKSLPEMTSIQLESIQPIELDHLPGYEVIATAKDKWTSHPLDVYMVTLFEKDTYYLMVGVVAHQTPEIPIASFQKMAQSFHRHR